MCVACRHRQWQADSGDRKPTHTPKVQKEATERHQRRLFARTSSKPAMSPSESPTYTDRPGAVDPGPRPRPLTSYCQGGLASSLRPSRGPSGPQHPSQTLRSRDVDIRPCEAVRSTWVDARGDETLDHEALAQTAAGTHRASYIWRFAAFQRRDSHWIAHTAVKVPTIVGTS